MNRYYYKEFNDYLAKEKTLAVMMLDRSEKFGDLNALRYMKDGTWQSITWKVFGEKIRAVAKGLLELNIQPGEMAAIFSQNRPEWAIADLGILSTRGVSVPVYATNSVEETEYIVSDAEVRIIFTGDQEQYDKARRVREKSKYLKTIIAMDRETKIGQGDMYFDDLVGRGRASKNDPLLESRLKTVNSEDLLTLIYTSGTTGNPKGAIHTHKSFIAGIFPCLNLITDVHPGQVSLAILPLSHVFERMWSYGCMSMGVEIAYCPDPKQFVAVMDAIRPHYLTSVPRIWEKVYGTITDGLKTAPPVKRGLFNWSTSAALKYYRKKQSGRKPGPLLSLKHSVADRLVCSAVRQKLGCGNNLIYHVGGAAFATEINEFFKSFGINIVQGYGLTEFFPVCVGYGDKGRDGACGPLIPMVDVRISDEGEIQLRGLNAMKGYYKKDEATRAVFTEDGWFKTGDVGHVQGDGDKYIVITDRIKDLIITAGGKNISPQQIELLLGDEIRVEQIVVTGEGKQYITALVVPNFEFMKKYAAENSIEYTSIHDLVTNRRIIELFEGIIAERTRSLGRVEQIKKIRLLPKELTQETGELTPTLKLKRKVINQKYNDLIESMYRE